MKIRQNEMLFHIFIKDPRNGRKADSGVARLQGVEGSGMAGPVETLGSSWMPLAIRACNLWSSCYPLVYPKPHGPEHLYGYIFLFFGGPDEIKSINS
jgi:hypothetical protein